MDPMAPPKESNYFSLSYARIPQKKARKKSKNDRACQPGYYERVSINPRLERVFLWFFFFFSRKTQRCKMNGRSWWRNLSSKALSLIETVNVTETLRSIYRYCHRHRHSQSFSCIQPLASYIASFFDL